MKDIYATTEPQSSVFSTTFHLSTRKLPGDQNLEKHIWSVDLYARSDRYLVIHLRFTLHTFKKNNTSLPAGGILTPFSTLVLQHVNTWIQTSEYIIPRLSVWEYKLTLLDIYHQADRSADEFWNMILRVGVQDDFVDFEDSIRFYSSTCY